ncbi:hypothetical protein CTEN210_13381 [Chaetoceros tenuissimus]|uniref:HSF-type DNA-binding domain-containing protein n=1 Tax=Chaetoceros tenuissimus TaxID=426638 RepID=A0AAD3D5G5_9STRA|nr:hypothetical protein CTEN210_13381 [Chaetoceros tenuissimus]
MNPLTEHTSITQSEDTAPMHNQKQHSQRGGCKYPFPQRLFDLLEKADDVREEPENLSSIISWSPNGKYFRVHNRKDFEDLIQKNHFNQSKYASFRRQLNLWGFERIPDQEKDDHSERSLVYGGCYLHPLFQRHDRSLCCSMSRVVGRNGSKELSKNSVVSTGSNRSFGSTGRSDAHFHDQHASPSSLSTMENQPFSFNPISVSPLLLDGLDGLEPYLMPHDSMKSFINQDDTTMIDANTLLSLLTNNPPQEESHLIPLCEELSLDQPQQGYGQDKSEDSSSTTDDKEFQELITFLSANDDNIQKYLFES